MSARPHITQAPIVTRAALQQPNPYPQSPTLPSNPSAAAATSQQQQQQQQGQTAAALHAVAAAAFQQSQTLPPLAVMPKHKLNSAAMASVGARAAEHQKVCVFDVVTGHIQLTNNRDVDRTRLIDELYRRYQNNDSLKSQLFQVVTQLSLARRKELAHETLVRFHDSKQRAMLARKMLPDSVSRHRANLLKHLEIERCFGDLSKDTSELSAVRIASAAVDALLYHEAQKVADAHLKQRRSLILPEGARPVDVLALRLDAWRRQNVPFAPRTIVQ